MEFGVHLTTVSDPIEADIICSLLRAAGIECGSREATGTWVGSFNPGFWQEIFVAESDLQAARELLAKRRD
jgi:Putative prokaryotic signal transducing protein